MNDVKRLRERAPHAVDLGPGGGSRGGPGGGSRGWVRAVLLFKKDLLKFVHPFTEYQ